LFGYPHDARAKWQINDVTSAGIEKSKHVLIEVGGAVAANLHFHAGSKDVAEEILAKLEASRSLARGSTKVAAPSQAERRAVRDFESEPEPEHTLPSVLIRRALPPPLPTDGVHKEKLAQKQRARAVAAAAEAEQRRKEKESRARGEREREERQRQEEEEAEEEARQEKRVAKVTAEAAHLPKSLSEGRKSNKKRAYRARCRFSLCLSFSHPLLGTPPDPSQTREWRDRTGQFRIEAAFFGFKNGMLRLHKTNGLIIEVPSEKMSVNDMRYVEKMIGGRGSTSRKIDEQDDEPLGKRQPSAQPAATSQKKAPSIDWFEFFLNAGCDVDDCTRYASSFEREKIDESILPDVSEGILRTLGLREGDIIRVNKVIEARHPKPTTKVASSDANLLGSDETSSSARGPPNLFTGLGGQLKNALRRRSTSSKTSSTAPGAVDLDAISTAPEQIARSTTPLVTSPVSAQTVTTTITSQVQAPPTTNSAAASGLDDDAWTNRPSSTKYITPTPSIPGALPAAPPAPTPPQPPRAPSAPETPTAASTNSGTGGGLSKTESDIFDQLARLSQLRVQNPAPTPSVPERVPLVPPIPSVLPAVPPALTLPQPLSPPSAPLTHKAASTGTGTGGELSKTTEPDIFDQLARLSQLRVQNPAPAAAPKPSSAHAPSPSVTSPLPVGYNRGLGVTDANLPPFPTGTLLAIPDFPTQVPASPPTLPTDVVGNAATATLARHHQRNFRQTRQEKAVVPVSEPDHRFSDEDEVDMNDEEGFDNCLWDIANADGESHNGVYQIKTVCYRLPSFKHRTDETTISCQNIHFRRSRAQPT
jgi:hypothetical protein